MNLTWPFWVTSWHLPFLFLALDDSTQFLPKVQNHATESILARQIAATKRAAI